MDVEVFIGDLNDPDFDRENGNWSGNCPTRISKFFPRPHNIFFKIIDKIDNKELSGRKTDWGSWTLFLYPEQMIEVIEELYGKETFAKDNQIKQIVSFIKKLDPKQQYGLVACEMS